MIAALAQPPVARLLYTRRTWLVAGGWWALAVVFALLARSGGATHPADRALLGAYAPFILPLVSYVLAGAAAGSRSLPGSVLPLVSFGASPARAAAVTLGVAVVMAAMALAVLGALVAVLAHGAGDPPVGTDLVTSAYAGALGGAAYASFFLLGATFGKRGGGRTLLFVVDWVLGAGDAAPALWTPRAHARNLLGGLPPLQLSQRASAVFLLGLCIACGALAVLRVHREARG